MSRTSRFWGAVLVDGQPRADVRDVTDPQELADILRNRVLPEFRWFRVMDLESGNHFVDGEDCVGGVLCGPGAPCANCVRSAVDYWYLHADRTAQRRWRAGTEMARDRRDGWAAADWCACRKSHPSEQAARRCATRHGLPLVCEMDGHGHRLRWISVNALLGFRHG